MVEIAMVKSSGESHWMARWLRHLNRKEVSGRVTRVTTENLW
jgi:predicted alpha/beta hydrolase family esterase